MNLAMLLMRGCRVEGCAEGNAWILGLLFGGAILVLITDIISDVVGGWWEDRKDRREA